MLQCWGKVLHQHMMVWRRRTTPSWMIQAKRTRKLWKRLKRFLSRLKTCLSQDSVENQVVTTLLSYLPSLP
eukprot:3462443-Prorocentrum_lima.AAC.1